MLSLFVPHLFLRCPVKVVHCNVPFLGKWIKLVYPLYTDTRYYDKIRYNDKLNVTKPSLKNGQLIRIMQEYCVKTSSNICFGYLLESHQKGDSNKYPKHMFFEEIRIKQGLSYMLFCPLRMLYNSKYILMATSLGTNAVVITKTYLFKHTENFTTKKWTFSEKKILIFFIFLPKT